MGGLMEGVVRWLDWAGHEYVTWEFGVGVVVAVVCIVVVVVREWKMRREGGEEGLKEEEVGRLYQKAVEAMEKGDKVLALQGFLTIVQGGVFYKKNDVSITSVHHAAVLARDLNKPDVALKLIQLEKYYYESVLVTHANPHSTPYTALFPPSSLSEQRCADFLQLSQMFTARKDHLMALDYALKAYALKQKIEGKKTQQNVNGLAGVVSLLEQGSGDKTEEALNLVECYKRVSRGVA